MLRDLLGCGEDKLRVIAPDVGGGFGPKFVFYAEEAVVALAARILGRPVKWIEDRREHFTATTQERDQFWDVEMALDAEGRILGIRGTLIHDHGAYSPYGVNLPYNSATNLLGPYVVPAYSLDIRLAATNKVPVTPVRGAGRPQGTFVMERLLDRAAGLLGIERAEIRRRNLIGPEAMPYVTPVKNRDGTAMTYDSGDYPATQALSLEASEHDAFRARQAALRREGRYVGIGIGNYVEGTGRGPFESARIRINPSGRVTIATGATAQGQGLKTALAQVCASALGLDPDAVEVTAGDTDSVSLGLGAFASRQAVTAGSSVHVAASSLAEKAIRTAAHILEAAPADLELADGQVRVRGVPDMAVGLGEIARALAGQPGYALPGGDGAGDGGARHVHARDRDLLQRLPRRRGRGRHRDRSGRNPALYGGPRLRADDQPDDCRRAGDRRRDPRDRKRTLRAHGVRRCRAADDGQSRRMPDAGRLRDAEARPDPHRVAGTPLNPIGAKGAGEGGVIPAPAAIAAAVEDALAPFGVVIDDVPITPDRVAAAVAAARG